MTTDQPCSDLLDIGAIADMLGCTQASARTIISRSVKTSWPFPEPCIRLGGSPGYAPEDVEAWIAGRPGAGKGPRPNRRKTDEQRMRALMGNRDYMTAGQMAKWLGVSIEQLSRMRGNAPRPTKAGGFLRFFRTEIDEWLEARDARDNSTRAS